ncbi:Dihydrolipoyl dehydrogenase [Candidatus Cyrtobacter comes]|uniref:Dihydrolipoyl dehydrogenase n=1 Tax=Candidatus Cyrtobacter comes TaxID=675776 RepID=A0ABU5L6Z4_9RICK|nr:dihydrolipoyl dehydrogenase [Candidatus Cyrtobacter comes]MDZ5761895.1 Dihydrolipoyl dehydrogenase [Candidatus Cyrtobacter comes]
MKNFDLAIIGGGPGGYVCAIKAAQLGKKVVCIDASERLGGTCLNRGCIPSKALLHSSYKYYDALNHFNHFGISFEKISFSLDEMMARKERIKDTLGKGISGLFKKNGIVHYNGIASFNSANTLNIRLKDGADETIEAKNIVIATGSEPILLPGIEVDEEKIVTSTGALSLNTVPQRMVVLGGGVIGLELGSVWARLGSEVTIVEYSSRVLSTMDSDISREVEKILLKQGINFMHGAKAISASNTQNGVVLKIERNGALHEIESDILLVSVGRKAYTRGLAIEKAGIELDHKGKIKIDSNFQTSVPGIYAIGDVVHGPMLAHKAEEDGIAVAEIISGQAGHVNYNAVPSVIYIHPEVASVGKSEDELIESGVEYKVGKFPFIANSRARTNDETDGFVKILACKHTDTILGAHIVGTAAGDMISELAMSIEFKASSEDIARISHSHPGFSEAIKEAAFATFAKAIHI